MIQFPSEYDNIEQQFISGFKKNNMNYFVHEDYIYDLSTNTPILYCKQS